ncbi:MAG: S-layer homology domain-containing protein [Oscillospiraceae bacterium]|nr:S-layer homology domain-containing protein [Oscillospiraceae bacterium]
MKKKIFGIAVSLIFALALAVAAAAAEKNSASEKIEGSFGYWSGFGASSHETGRIAPFEYEDGYFSKAPDIYDHDLAKMSLALSLCTYDLKELERVLSEIGFAQIEPNGYYARSNKNAANTEPDNIGVAIASKNIGDFTVLAAVIRGFGYGAEWAGNFEVGMDENFHAGFKKARDIVTDEIASYIQSHQIGGDLKIWLTGYSRAGAVANLVAGEICGGQKFGDAKLYAYCFEAPMGLRVSNGQNTGCAGVFNIVNPNDIAAKLAMRDWGFGRYGTDICLPSPESAGREYEALSEKMKEMYLAYRPAYPNEPGRLDDFRENMHSGGLGAFIDGLLSAGAFVLDSEGYVENLQQMFFDSCAKAKGLDVDLWSLISSAPDVASYLALHHFGEINTAMENSELIFSAHFPDLCLAWMHSLDGEKMMFCNLPFGDVKTSDWFYETVCGAYAKNLMAGVSDFAFEPEGKVTIAEAAAMAARAHAGGDAPFKHASGADWHDIYVNYAISNGIIKPGEFADWGAAATRAQMAYILANIIPAESQTEKGAQIPPDVKESDEYGAEIYLLYALGILAGNDGEGTFLPRENLTRAQAAAMLLRVYALLQ